MRRNRALRFALFAPMAIAGLALFGILVRWLWNAVLPPVTGWHEITYWQALGLLVLSKILFGGFGCGSGRWYSRRRMRERWAELTPEEREKFRDAMRSRCGGFDEPSSPRPAE